MAFGKLFSVLLSYLQNGEKISACLVNLLWGLNEIVHIKPFKKHPSFGKHSMNVNCYYYFCHYIAQLFFKWICIIVPWSEFLTTKLECWLPLGPLELAKISLLLKKQKQRVLRCCLWPSLTRYQSWHNNFSAQNPPMATQALAVYLQVHLLIPATFLLSDKLRNWLT